ncbi:MAG: helix-turn-helix domain-containing protein [Lachnospiraceae bacterium]|nr:helix-turn-helix domain-containing protein [Lachnospiraceae bacterium]
MISNQILQNTIDGMKNIARVDFSVLDSEGKEVATTSANHESYRNIAAEFAKSPADSQEIKGCQYFKIFDDNLAEYILVVSGSGEDAYLVGKMAAFQIQNLMVAYKERFDKDNFIKNLLLDNLLLIDIYSRSKKLHIETDLPRVVMVMESDTKKDVNVLEIVRACVGFNNKDFVTAVDEKDVIIVKDLSEGSTAKDIVKASTAIVKSLEKEGVTGVRVAYGTMVHEIKEVSRSYKEAKMAMDVGKIFYEDRNIIAYDQLGIGRLIYQLPLPLCKMFIKEIFQDKTPENFDEETLTTINKFFENSLNVSETSRQLFIHRNTLVYRLDKLQKSTGLDLRIFDDAITFHIALMVVKYMKYMETFEF